MLLKIVGIIILCIYLALNFITAKFMSISNMRSNFVDGQCLVGKIFTNIFYAPAWILKWVRFLVILTIA